MGLIDQPGNGAGDLEVMRILYHDTYHPEDLSYDIALIKTTQPVTFNGENLGPRFDYLSDTHILVRTRADRN